MQDLPRSLKLATVWALIGTAVFLAVQWQMAERQKPRMAVQGGVIELRRSPDGHFHWPGRLAAADAGRDGTGWDAPVEVDFLVDTGASSTTLPQALAERLGLPRLAPLRSDTAGGVVQGYLTRVDLQLAGGVNLKNLRAGVLPQLSAPLLGMDVLGRLRFTQGDGVMRIETGATPSRLGF